MIVASGEFDIAAVPEVHSVIREAAGRAPAPARVTIDLAGVTFLDAAMLGALVSERHALQDAGGELELTGVSAWVHRVIDICGLRDTLGV